MHIQTQNHKESSIFVSIGIVFVLIALLTAISLHPAKPQDNDFQQYAVFFSPTMKEYDILKVIDTVDAIPLRSGLFNFIMIVATKNIDFQQEVKSLGAFLVTSPIVTGSCYIENKKAI